MNAVKPSRLMRISLLLAGLSIFVLLAVLLGPTSAVSLLGGFSLLLFGLLWPVLWLSSFFFRQLPLGANPGAEQPMVTIIVPARDEEAVIERMVHQVLRQSYEHWELLLVVNNTTDHTAELARHAAQGDGRVRVLEQAFARGTKASALNYALPMAVGDVVLQLDADNVIEAGYVAGIAAVLSDLELPGVQTQIRALNRASLLALLQDVEFLVYSEVFNRGRSALGFGSSIGGTGFAIRRSLIAEMGGWQPGLVEDFDLHMRLVAGGIRVAYCPDLVVYDEKPEMWAALIRQRRRWVRGHVGIAIARLGESGIGLIDQLYLASPLLIGLSAMLLALGYAFRLAPTLFDSYAYFSPWFWAASLLLTGVAVASTIIRAREWRLLLLLPLYLLVFSFHWMLVFAASLVPVDWNATKTAHGCRTGRATRTSGVERPGSLVLLAAVIGLAVLWMIPLAQGLAHTPLNARRPLLYASRSMAVASADVLSAGARVHGLVHQSDGTPVSGGAIAVTTLADGTAYASTSTTDGSFSMPTLPTGTYRIDVSKSGFQTASAQFFLPEYGSVAVDVRLAPFGGGIGVAPIPY
jgi:1,2-diacylglycerol 3-beta-glucosyltransferase